MLEGIGDLTTIFRQGQRLLDQVLNVADLYLVLLEVFSDLLVDITRTTEYQVFIFRP